MEKRGHYDEVNNDSYINISANSNTLKSILIIEPSYQVDFNQQNNLSKVLGFTGKKYVEGFHESENVVNILSIVDVYWGFWDKLFTPFFLIFPHFSPFFQSRTTFQILLNILKNAFRYIIQLLHRMIYSTYSSKSSQLNSISLKA